MLAASDLGIGTCWVTGLLRNGKFAQDFDIRFFLSD